MEREHRRQIGQYQIQRVLSTGGMATVYAALQRPRRDRGSPWAKPSATSSWFLSLLRRGQLAVDMLR